MGTNDLNLEHGINRILIDTAPPSKKANSPIVFDTTDSGHFHTDHVRHPSMTSYRLHDHIFVKFSTKFASAPNVITGLTENVTDRKWNVRIKAGADKVHKHAFHLNIWSYSTTRLYHASCLWFAVPANDPHFQAGGLELGGKNTMLKHCKVSFGHAYESPPKVVIWLNHIDFDNTRNERVTAFATDITTTGFTAHINSWGDSILHSTGISWFAYPFGTPGIRSGDVLVEKDLSDMVTFEKPFNKPPRRVLVALNKLETDVKGFCRFKVIHEAVSEEGMGVRFESWGDTIIHSAGAAYLAIE